MTTKTPRDNAEVFKDYYTYIKRLVRKHGIRKDYVDDYAMILMTKILEKDLLAQYDPERTTVVGGEVRTTSFKTLLYAFVDKYIRHFAHRDRIEAGRSSLSTDLMLGEDKDVPLLDYIGFSDSADLDKVEIDIWISKVAHSYQDNHKMTLFLEMVLLQVTEQGKVDATELSELFGVTRSTIYNWLKILRQDFEKCR